MKIRLMAKGQEYDVDQVGVFSPKPVAVAELGVGEVGFIFAGIKTVSDAQIGDTITEASRRTEAPFPGFKVSKPMVFAGLYPVEGSEYPQLRDALEKLRLNDASFFWEPETSAALGFGFRCGFLGLLHMEIVQERLEREFGMDLITTAPGVLYRVTTTDGVVQEIDSPSKLPDTGRIEKIEEPIITAMMLTPAEHVGAILQLCQEKRGVQKSIEYLAENRVLVTYELPFNEVVMDFYDRLKTISRGLRLPRLPCDRVPGSAAGEARHPRERGAGGRALDHRPPRHGLPARPRAGLEDARAHPAPDVRDRDPGGHRQPHHRARVGQGPAQERAGEVLRRRHLAQAQAPREAEGREEADEARRPRGDPAGSLSGGVESGDGMTTFHKSTVREYFESIVIAVILALFVRTWVVQAFKIPTGSMENNLLIGDHLLVNKFVFGPTATAPEFKVLPVRDIRRQDVVVFKYPDEPERDFIKRVIGLPGETLELRSKKVYINGQPLDEPYVHFLEPASTAQEVTSFDVRERYGPVRVPEGHYFVMGDNRDNSQDSRYWGFLPRHYIKGRALMIYWSYESGREDYLDEGVGATVKRLFSVVTHFFTKTRWERLFHQIH